MPAHCVENLGVYIVILFSMMVIAAEVIELVVDFDEWTQFQRTYTREQFTVCLAPQIVFRIAFTLFALFAALFCLLISAAILTVHGTRLDKCIKYMLVSMYFVFGPMMLVACAMGFVNFNSFYYSCIDDDPKKLIANYPNLFVLLVGGSLSFCITLAYSLAQIARWVNNLLGDEDSCLARAAARYWEWRLHRTLRVAIDRRREQILSSRAREEEEVGLKDDEEEFVRPKVDFLDLKDEEDAVKESNTDAHMDFKSLRSMEH